MADDDAWARRLVEHIRQGSRDAETELIARYQLRVRVMLLARTGNPDTARDLTQDVMIEALHALRAGRLRQAERLPAFIHGIARNILSSYGRSLARRAEVTLPAGDSLAVRLDDPVIAGERRDRLRRALRTLSPPDRTILILILAEGLSPAEVALRFDMTAETVRQRKSRALKRIREELARRPPVRPRPRPGLGRRPTA
jgi:RNA polymerase sigma-70 factor (ECF subfamily)